MNVNDVVAAKVEAARLRIEATKRRRAALAAARQRGLAHRHAAKLRNLQASQQREASRPAADGSAADNPSAANDPDDVLIEVTSEEFHAAVRTSLARLGLTYAELEDQARRRDFTSAQAHSLWVSIGGAVNTDLLEENQ